MRSNLSLSLAITLLASGIASADVTITTADDGDGKDHTVTYIAGGKVRVDTMQGADSAYMLWESGKAQVTMVMPKRKRYMVTDQASVKEQMAKAAEATKQFDAQMASMPPQVREMMKKNMPNMGSGRPLLEMKVSKTGRTEKHNGYACQVVEVQITGMPMAGPMGQVHCVVAPEKIGIPSADLATMKAMAAFSKEMTKDMGQMVGGMPDLYEMGGWPVWTKDLHDGKSYGMKSISTGKVDAALFSVPAGYQQEKMPQMGGPPER